MSDANPAALIPWVAGGAFALAFATYFLARSAVFALVGQPLLIRHTDEERVVIGTKAKSVSAGALLRTLARRVTATNSVTGKVNPEAMAEYEADLKDRVSKL